MTTKKFWFHVRELAFVLAFIIFIAWLTGCSAVQAKLDANIQAVTIPDLKAAIADATAAGDDDGVSCWVQVLDYVQSPPTTNGVPLPTILGVASGIEVGRITAQQPLVSAPPIPHALHKACAPLVVDAQLVAAKLGISAFVVNKGAVISGKLGAAKALESKLGVHP